MRTTAEAVMAFGKRYGVDVDFPIIGHDDGAIMEYTLHELGHWMALGRDVTNTTCMSDEIAIAVNRLDYISQLDCEARAWAIEWTLVRALRLKDVLDWNAMVAAAADQEVGEHHIMAHLETSRTQDCVWRALLMVFATSRA